MRLRLRSRSRWAGGLISVLVAGLLVAGCSGGENDSASASAPAATQPVAPALTAPTATGLTAAESYRRQAGALCREQRAASDALPPPTTPEEIVDFLELGLAALTPIVDRQAALTPPPELADLHARAVAKRAELLASIRSTVERARAGADARAVLTQSQPRLDALDAELDRLGTQLGVPECVGDGTAATSTAAGPVSVDTSAGSRPAAPTTGDAELDRFLTDVEVASATLTGVAATIEAADGLVALRAGERGLRQGLDELDAAISRMDSYTLASPTMETWRGRLVAQGPPVGDLLRRFLDAVAARDGAAVRRIEPDLVLMLHSFAAVAQPSTP